MDQTPETVIAHVDQPAFEQMQIDHSISRVAIFFVCFLTIGVFYFTLVNFQVARLLPIQQIQQVQQVVNAINPAASRGPSATTDRPTGALGGSQIGASAVPSGSAAASAPASAAAKPSASASVLPVPSGGVYAVEPGDTLTTIARKFNISVQSIADANKMTANATMQVGQKLTIPRS